MRGRACGICAGAGACGRGALLQVDWFGSPFADGSRGAPAEAKATDEATAEALTASGQSPGVAGGIGRAASAALDRAAACPSSKAGAWPGCVSVVAAADNWLWAAWGDGGTAVALVALAAVGYCSLLGCARSTLKARTQATPRKRERDINPFLNAPFVFRRLGQEALPCSALALCPNHLAPNRWRSGQRCNGTTLRRRPPWLRPFTLLYPCMLLSLMLLLLLMVRRLRPPNLHMLRLATATMAAWTAAAVAIAAESATAALTEAKTLRSSL